MDFYVFRESDLSGKFPRSDYRRINSRFSYVINMADFCSSLQWTSIGDIDIFAFISQ